MAIFNHPYTRRHQRGSVLPFVVVILVVLMGFVALAVDIGHLYSVHAELQIVANTSALAGATGLIHGQDEARARATAYAALNRVNDQPVVLDNADIEFGSWSLATHSFIPMNELPSGAGLDAVRVTPRLTAARGNSVNLAFAKMFGHTTSDVTTSATARFGSRDIMLVIDASASMNDDSELQHINDIGQAAIETNLFQIWTELGSPVFGNMQFQPIFEASDDNATLQTVFGLDAVPYPFPSGSWGDYFNYVKTDFSVAAAGYQKHYGYLTLVNYWLARQPAAHQTPDLWMTTEQPITAVKDAVGLFFSYLNQVDTNDRVGLSLYTSTDGQATLESSLTDDYPFVEDIVRQRQAGHYTGNTNIGAGIENARTELIDNSRDNTINMIVLLSDGKANLPNDSVTARQFALEQAQLAADNGIVILTVSLGVTADIDLLQQIADITGGVHFNIPTGAGVDDYSEDLNSVFISIAAHRPPRLVQ